MDDVIFAGSAKRSALGRAEVSLTIDNSAGLLPIDFTEVTITRILFRSGDSEYAINGVPCRLLDIQELLSDSGVGRQQHVIVSQGQIDAVLNARPEDRRLDHRRSRGRVEVPQAPRTCAAPPRLHRSEHDAAYGSAARSAAAVASARKAGRGRPPLRRRRRRARRRSGCSSTAASWWRCSAVSKGRHRGATRLAQEINDLRAVLARLDAEVIATEAQLSAHGGDDIGDVLTRFEALRERARGLSGLLTERLRGIEKDRAAFVDRGLVASLEAESARVASELAEVRTRSRSARARIESLALHEAELADARGPFGSEWAEGVAVPSGKAAEVRGELGALRAAVERADGRGRAATTACRRALNDQRRLARRRRAAPAGRAAPRSVMPKPRLSMRSGRRRARARLQPRPRSATPRDELADCRSRIGFVDRPRRWSGARARRGAQPRPVPSTSRGLDGMVGTLLDLVDIDARLGARVRSRGRRSHGRGRRRLRSTPARTCAAFVRRAATSAGAVLALGAHRKADQHALSRRTGAPSRARVRPVGRRAVSMRCWAASCASTAICSPVSMSSLRHPEAVIVTRRRRSPQRRRLAARWARGRRPLAPRSTKRARNADARASIGATRRAPVSSGPPTPQRVERRSVAPRPARRSTTTTAASLLAPRRCAASTRSASTLDRRARVAADARVDELIRAHRPRAAHVSRELEALLPQYEAEETELLERGRAMAASRSRHRVPGQRGRRHPHRHRGARRAVSSSAARCCGARLDEIEAATGP